MQAGRWAGSNRSERQAKRPGKPPGQGLHPDKCCETSHAPLRRRCIANTKCALHAKDVLLLLLAQRALLLRMRSADGCIDAAHLGVHHHLHPFICRWRDGVVTDGQLPHLLSPGYDLPPADALPYAFG